MDLNEVKRPRSRLVRTDYSSYEKKVENPFTKPGYPFSTSTTNTADSRNPFYEKKLTLNTKKSSE